MHSGISHFWISPLTLTAPPDLTFIKAHLSAWISPHQVHQQWALSEIDPSEYWTHLLVSESPPAEKGFSRHQQGAGGDDDDEVEE